MGYDALTESLRLIESRELAPVTRLSRRRRHVSMAVDVAGDIAVTMFLRRSVGCNVQEIHVLAHHSGKWFMLGGGGGSAAVDALEYRCRDAGKVAQPERRTLHNRLAPPGAEDPCFR